MVEVRELALPGVLEILPQKFGDERGFFSETYNQQSFAAAGVNMTFVQDNLAYSAEAGVLRGLHYQLPPLAQTKLVRVSRGRIFDVVVDIRKSSTSYGKWLGVEISAAKWNQVLVPAGYAHGYMTLEPETEVAYKVDAFYTPSHERSIRFDDPAIGIDWPLGGLNVRLSQKDAAAGPLQMAETFP